MGKLVVSDTNIFIDLIHMGLLRDFFLLPFDITTVDFVIRELKKAGQKETVLEYEARRELKVIEFSEAEIEDIFNLKQSTKGNVSYQDCAVWFCAKKINAAILTGDRALTIRAKEDNVEVHGLLYVLDQMVCHNIIPTNLAADKLEELAKENKRLPEDIINEFIHKWRYLSSIASV